MTFRYNRPFIHVKIGNLEIIYSHFLVENLERKKGNLNFGLYL